MNQASPSAAAEHVLRELAPRVLGAVVRRYGDFAAAEDAVQEALLAALLEWPARGLPRNPGGWLYQTACRRMSDHDQSEQARRRREQAVGSALPESAPPADAASDDAWSAALQHDDTLALLYSCCHPALTPPSAVALTLRAVGGLTTAEIARAFLVPEATLAQRVSRAKQAIQESGIPLALPTAAERAERLGAVLHVLYLVFSEGYASGAGPELVRVELSAEAIRLARLLFGLVPDEPEVAGLLALMLLTDARRRARTGCSGELVPLDEQDRSLWDRRAIDEGAALVGAAFAKGRVGAYQLQAAIAALHGEAPSTSATDWPQILALYTVLLRMSDNPMVALNHAIAAAMVRGPRAGLELLRPLERDARIASGHRLDAVRGHLLELAGERAAAVLHYRRAAERTGSTPERDYLLKKAARLGAAD